MDAAAVTAFVNVSRLLLDIAPLLSKLATDIQKDAGLNDDINCIKDELKMKLSYLEDESNRQGRGHKSSVSTKTWVRQVRDLTYDADDYFQELVVHVQKRVPSTKQARKMVVDKIRGLKQRIQHSNTMYNNLLQAESRSDNTSATSSIHYPHTQFATIPTQALLIGREKEESHIIQMITKVDKTRQIIPIWGMAGLGKTTLARSIYKNQNIGCIFQKYVWITLSHPFNAEEFFRNLVMQLQESDMTPKEPLANINLTELIEKSNKLLQGRTYLIVLDNVPSISVWDIIMQYIADEENLSRIIVTTREKSVAEHCSIDNIYKLQALDDKDALRLFINKVFKEPGSFGERPEMVEQAKCILRKCNGLPLAIATVGGFLATRPRTASVWENFNEEFSSQLENNPSLEKIRTVVISSFEALPYHLKLFLFYLSVFPQDENMRRRRLVRRWIAEGYSSDTHYKTAEENGERYFTELISRSIVQPSETVLATGSGASVDYCHVQSLLHEIIVSMSVEEKFSFVLHNRSNLQTNDKIRHLSIRRSWNRVEDQLNRIGNLSQLRSLTVCGEWKSFLLSKEMGMLRVLDLEGTSGLKDHDVKHIITMLIHLKYLSLRGCDGLVHLPSSLGNLWDLQTLDVRGTNIILLPETIVKLQKLQYLRAGRVPEDEEVRDHFGRREDGVASASLDTTLRWTAATVGLAATLVKPQLLGDDFNRKDAANAYCYNFFHSLARGLDIHGVELPRGVGSFDSLHTLGVINLSAGNLKAVLAELGKATQLHKLGVTGLNGDNSKQLFSAISKLSQLQSLSIRSEGKPGLQDCLDDCDIPSSPPGDLRSLKLYGNLVKLPAWVSRLRKLAKLKLRSTRLGQDAIQVMGMLPLLAVLRLLGNSVRGKDLRFHFRRGSFPSLVLLQLDGLGDLRSVEFERNSATKLELLQVNGCCNMGKKEDGFSGLSSLPSLREVSIDAGHDKKFMQELRTQVAANPSQPIFRESKAPGSGSGSEASGSSGLSPLFCD